MQTACTLALLVAALALAGCDPVYYFKTGVTEAEQKRDEAECMRIYRAGSASMATCMVERGYSPRIDSGRPRSRS